MSSFAGIASKILDILPSEWPKVSVAWYIRLFAKTGFIIGITTLTAMFVFTYGISNLPIFFVAYALFTILGTICFSMINRKYNKPLLIISCIILGSICLFSAQYFYLQNIFWFFFFAFAALGVFYTQLEILLSIFTEDLFSPLESQRTFPIIESADTIGGIIGGSLIVFLLPFLNPAKFLYIWIILTYVTVPILLLFYRRRQKLPVFDFEDAPEKKKYRNIFKAFRFVRKKSFLKGLFVIIILQGLFISLLDYQYTKAVDQHVTHSQELTLLQKKEGAIVSETAIAPAHYEKDLAAGLGKLHILFSVSALAIQLLLASRLIRTLGIVNSIALNPIVSLINLIGLIINYRLLSAIIIKTGHEITHVVQKNAYHSSFYALPPESRADAKEFLEGIGKPFGLILGTIGLLILQAVYSAQYLTLAVNITIGFVLAISIVVIFTLHRKYTNLSKKQLQQDGEFPGKFHAIEILSQKGHHNGAEILSNRLGIEKSETVRIKILEVLGKLQDEDAIPDIIDAFQSKSKDEKVAAIKALSNFKRLERHFYEHAFALHRIISELKKLFMSDLSPEVKEAALKLLAKLQKSEIVPLVLSILKSRSKETKISCIYAMKEFNDINVAYYLKKDLTNKDPYIRAAVMAVLWKYKRFRSTIRETIEHMKTKKNIHEHLAVITAIQNTSSKKHASFLEKSLRHKNKKIRLASAICLVKMHDAKAISIVCDHIISLSKAQARSFIQSLPQTVMKKIQPTLKKSICAAIHKMYMDFNDKKTSKQKLYRRLQFFYELAEQYDEVYKIEEYLTMSPCNA